jgi:hypothetical protein
VFCIVVLLIVALAAARQYVVSSRSMVVSSGFRSSPGRATLGNAIRIAPAPAMAIKMASGRGALFLNVDFVIGHHRS